jgi:hypothetical protein
MLKKTITTANPIIAKASNSSKTNHIGKIHKHIKKNFHHTSVFKKKLAINRAINAHYTEEKSSYL